jgi:uroporphyrinogen decarboxylase
MVRSPTHSEKAARVFSVLQGDAVDRVPVSAWWHDYRREWTAKDLAGTTVEAYRRHGWDFIKVNPRFSYYAEDWGTTYRRFDDRMPEVDHRAVQSPEDLAKIRPVSGTGGAFGEQLEVLRLIGEALGGEAPFIQTVFSPLAVMTRITGSVKYTQRLMAGNPDELDAALGAITESLAEYAGACLEVGADGVFYAAVEWGTADNISWADYERFGVPHDHRVLEAVQGARFNVLHVCRERNHLMNLLEYPVDAFHWDATGEGNPGLAEVRAASPKAIIGGVSQRTMLTGGAADVTAEAERALAEGGGSRFMLAPGCSIDPSTPEGNLQALTEVAAG